MRISLDVSCYNRPFDDQSQARIRLETEAIHLILESRDSQSYELVVSEMTVFEIGAILDEERRDDVLSLLPDPGEVITITSDIRKRASELEALGIKPADALHVAAAEHDEADVVLTCDDKLLRAARRHEGELKVSVANPLDWVKARDGDDDAR